MKKSKSFKRLKKFFALALSVMLIAGSALTAHASTMLLSRPNTSTNYKTNVQLTYSRSEFKKLKGTTGKLDVSFSDGTKARVSIKYAADKVTVTAVKVTGHTNLWNVSCSTICETNKSLNPRTAVSKTLKVNSSGDVVLDFRFSLPR